MSTPLHVRGVWTYLISLILGWQLCNHAQGVVEHGGGGAIVAPSTSTRWAHDHLPQ